MAGTGASVCTKCEAGKYVAAPASGAAGAQSCTACGNANYNSPASSVIHTACVCNAGYWSAAIATAGNALNCQVIRHAPARFSS
jgi:hypothetical protein